MPVSTIPLASAVSGTLPDGNAPSGSVIQVVSTTATGTATSNGSEVTIVTLAITPSSASSRILVSANSTFIDNRAAGRDVQVRLKRNSTVLSIDGTASYTYYMYQANGQTQVPFSGTYLDSPATTSSVTYGVFLFGAAAVGMSGCQLTLMEIAG
jgi:type 1 fimbria pilin